MSSQEVEVKHVKYYNINASNHGKSIQSGRTMSAGAGGPVVKVSNSTPVIQGPNGSLTLVVSSSSVSGAISPSPNVSVTSHGVTTSGKRGTSSSKSSTSRDKKGEVPGTSKDPSHNKAAKESKDVTLKSDLRNIMHAFGDGGSPIEESVQLMEVIIRQEMAAFTFICDTAAQISDSKVIGLRECIYVLRRDTTFLAKLFKYFAFKDYQMWLAKMNQHKPSSNHKPFMTEIRKVLADLDVTGELESLLTLESIKEGSKYDKSSRPDGNLHKLTSPKYINYAKARSVSFARKLAHLPEWVSCHLHCESKLTSNFLEVLSFLIYEMVAQIVDLSFVIKRERLYTGNPILKLLDVRGSNPDTCTSSSAFMRKDEECNNVSEILVLASELEAKRLKKVSNHSLKDSTTARSMHYLSPAEIREAYVRIQTSCFPSASFYIRAERMKNRNF